MSKHLVRSPSIMACELFGYAFRLGLSQKRPRIKGRASMIVPAAAGLGGPARPEYTPSQQRVTPARNPEEVVRSLAINYKAC